MLDQFDAFDSHQLWTETHLLEQLLVPVVSGVLREFDLHAVLKTGGRELGRTGLLLPVDGSGRWRPHLMTVGEMYSPEVVRMVARTYSRKRVRYTGAS